ncbi:hypothetical protein CYLTODRAFT_362105, partial [Cylindrobasidium torrendii FP15055 ss-10]
IVDRAHHFFAFLLGAPRDQASWKPVATGLGEVIEREKAGVRFSQKHLHHKRGHGFAAPAAGVSHCNGTKRPANRRQTKSVGRMMHNVCLSEPFRRLNGFVNSALRIHNRAMFDENERVLSALAERYPDIQRNFDGKSVFAAMTVNLGPVSVTEPHRDPSNKPDNWCDITAAGNFDHKLGGKLVLVEPKLIIEIPAGVTVFIPSALITHYNLPIAPGETRYSITQYSAGGLFRWVNNGFKTQEARLRYMAPQAKAAFDRERRARWHEGVHKYFRKLA